MNAPSVRGGFVEGVRGPLHRLVVAPVEGVPVRGTVVLVPPLDEEMNRSRRTLAALARALAARGRVCILTDPYGTGDSAGDAGEARWEVWLDDLCRELRIVRGLGTPVELVGLRSGCLLIDALPADALREVRSMALVAPEASRRALLRRWLMTEGARRRFAGEPDASAKALRARLAAGDIVGVAGRALHPALADALDAPESVESGSVPRRRYEIVEDVASADDSEAASKDGTRKLTGSPFWRFDEAPVDAALVEALAVELAGKRIESGEEGDTDAALRSHALTKTLLGTPANAWPERVWRPRSATGRLHAVGTLAKKQAAVAVVVVVGGGQYRVGAHRQFVLLARRLAERGVPALRVDLAGMGDADGAPRDFLDNAADLNAAIELAARELAPRVVLWGLCDGASAAALHVAAGGTDARVVGLVMVNPWIRTEAGAARVRLRRYYLERLRSPGLFGRLVRGRLDPLDSARSFAGAVRDALGLRPAPDAERDLPTLVLDAVAACTVPVLVAIAEADETAREFQAAFDARFPEAGKHAANEAVDADERCLAAEGAPRTQSVSRLERRMLPGDHTFSRATDRRRLEALTAAWISRLA